jgi:hypothetical protein
MKRAQHRTPKIPLSKRLKQICHFGKLDLEPLAYHPIIHPDKEFETGGTLIPTLFVHGRLRRNSQREMFVVRYVYCPHLKELRHFHRKPSLPSRQNTHLQPTTFAHPNFLFSPV